MALILVTGGAGAIGSNVVRRLIELKHQVTVIDDLSSGDNKLLPKEAHFIQGTVENDADLKKCFDQKPNYVIHLAALFANQNSVDHPEKDLSVNGLGTLKCLEFCRSAGVKKMLYSSSSCVYGHKEVMIENDQVFGLDTPYAITKLLGEKYCSFFADHYKFDVVTVRLFNTYGPGELPGRYRNVIPNFFKLALSGQSLTITGTGDETRDFTFVSDTAEGIVKALFAQTEPGEIFNIASGRETKIQDLARSINSLTGNMAPIIKIPKRDWDKVNRRRADITKAREKLDFNPSMELTEGLKKTLEWLRVRV
jgi:UDP-glucose 4-epimerase